MSIDELVTKRIGILGWSTNNRGVTHWLLSHGATRIEIFDEKDLEPEEVTGIAGWHTGANAFRELEAFDVLLRSPGIPLDHPALLRAKAAKIHITSQTRLFFEYCPAKTIGVTGTNGKGTTTTLIHKILEEEFSHQKNTVHERAFLAGNIGKDPFDFIDELTANDWVVLELSSFQLEDADTSPHIAVVLAITPDHLNHHRSLEEYHEAKRNIVAHQTSADYAVLNADNAISASFSDATPGAVLWYSLESPVADGVNLISVGDHPELVLVRDGKRQSAIDTTQIALHGLHNQQNVAAAMAAASLAGASIESITKVVGSFTGLPHRLQLVGTIHGVQFVDDSIAATPAAARAAVRTFTEPLVLILGGQGKKIDYSELVEEIERANVRAVVCYGEEGEVFKELLSGSSHQIVYERLFNDAFSKAVSLAKSGDVVLLSPSATSFGQFANYAERGDRFHSLVEELRHGA